MHRPFRIAAAALALGTLGACCSQPADTTTYRVAQRPSAVLRAVYEPFDGFFAADVQVDTGTPCDIVDASATADVAGVEMTSMQRPDPGTCSCEGTRFLLSGAPTPEAPEATIRVADASGEMTATAPQLFAARGVSVRGAPSQLTAGTRVYLDVLPAGETLEELEASFWTDNPGVVSRKLFTFRKSDGTLGSDGAGWYFDVPASAAGHAGVLASWARAQVATSCVGAGRCDVVATVRSWLNTAFVAP